jgi:hypothetical protein
MLGRVRMVRLAFLCRFLGHDRAPFGLAGYAPQAWRCRRCLCLGIGRLR